MYVFKYEEGKVKNKPILLVEKYLQKFLDYKAKFHDMNANLYSGVNCIQREIR